VFVALFSIFEGIILSSLTFVKYILFMFFTSLLFFSIFPNVLGYLLLLLYVFFLFFGLGSRRSPLAAVDVLLLSLPTTALLHYIDIYIYMYIAIDIGIQM